MIVLAIVMIERGIYRSFLTPTIAVAVPYLVTVFLDRTVGKKIGFPQITDTNILLLCLGIGKQVQLLHRHLPGQG